MAARCVGRRSVAPSRAIFFVLIKPSNSAAKRSVEILTGMRRRNWSSVGPGSPGCDLCHAPSSETASSESVSQRDCDTPMGASARPTRCIGVSRQRSEASLGVRFRDRANGSKSTPAEALSRSLVSDSPAFLSSSALTVSMRSGRARPRAGENGSMTVPPATVRCAD